MGLPAVMLPAVILSLARDGVRGSGPAGLGGIVEQTLGLSGAFAITLVTIRVFGVIRLTIPSIALKSSLYRVLLSALA